MDFWKSKIAVVTGSSRGIGASIATKLANNGITVIGLSRRTDLVEKLSEEVGKNGGKLYPIKCDISKIEEIQKVFKEIKETYGPIQILINNAASFKNGTIIDCKPEDIKQAIDTNLLGTTICTKEAIKQMKEKNLPGHIIMINSVMGQGYVPLPNFNIYPSTKFGLTILCKILQAEIKDFGDKIKITTINPALVAETDLFKSAKMDNLSEKVVNSFAHIYPEDIANGVVYALSTPPHLQIAELTLRAIGDVF